jgi:hypothetical protein
MFKLNDRRKYVFALFFILFVISFGIGFFVMDNSLNKQKQQLVSDVNEINEEVPNIEIVKEENRISPNTFIEERIHYKECGHLVSNVHLATDDIVNMTKEELVEHLYNTSSNLSLVTFSNVKVVLWGERNHLCKDHYVVGEENGKIAIFTISDNGERVLDKVFVEYPINILIDIDQEKLKEGIIVDSVDELSDILQDYIS